MRFTGFFLFFFPFFLCDFFLLFIIINVYLYCWKFQQRVLRRIRSWISGEIELYFSYSEKGLEIFFTLVVPPAAFGSGGYWHMAHGGGSKELNARE